MKKHLGWIHSPLVRKVFILLLSSCVFPFVSFYQKMSSSRYRFHFVHYYYYCYCCGLASSPHGSQVYTIMSSELYRVVDGWSQRSFLICFYMYVLLVVPSLYHFIVQMEASWPVSKLSSERGEEITNTYTFPMLFAFGLCSLNSTNKTL